MWGTQRERKSDEGWGGVNVVIHVSFLEKEMTLKKRPNGSENTLQKKHYRKVYSLLVLSYTLQR